MSSLQSVLFDLDTDYNIHDPHIFFKYVKRSPSEAPTFPQPQARPRDKAIFVVALDEAGLVF